MQQVRSSRLNKLARGATGGGICSSPVRLLVLASALSLGEAAVAAPIDAENPYAPRQSWDELTGSDLNISVFVFRDADGDGVYNVGDRPMSGIAVDASGMATATRSRSNAAGFANFRMSGTDAGADIVFEGEYSFETLVPPGWRLTTGNQVQTTRFRSLPGSPADVVADPAPSLVGLAPQLTVSGRLGRLRDAQAVELISSNGKMRQVPKEEEFTSTPLNSGEWRLQSEQGQVRRFVVEATPVFLADPLFRAESGNTGKEIVLGFDELQSEGVLKIPDGYGGLGWDNFVMTHQKFYDPEGYRNGVMSGEFLAYNGSGHPAKLRRDKPFDFVGGYFGASTLRAEGETLLITAWRGDLQIYQQEITLSALGPVYLDAQFIDVTGVSFETRHFWQFTLDNLVVRLD